MSRDRARLLHIRDAIQRIRSYVTDRDSFLTQPLIQDAVIRNLEVIGEAVKVLGPEIRMQRTEIPWSDIAAMRDRLIHGYFAVDLDLVWDVVADRLGSLEAAVESLLHSTNE
ncbi:MAG: DUF86 domain-containing protein [Acidobacteriota bacterium]|nr:DUF86 domain-containing protein [Acidobacteriota bacterium]